jgi:hypothetical protein
MGVFATKQIDKGAEIVFYNGILQKGRTYRNYFDV